MCNTVVIFILVRLMESVLHCLSAVNLGQVYLTAVIRIETPWWHYNSESTTFWTVTQTDFQMIKAAKERVTVKITQINIETGFALISSVSIFCFSSSATTIHLLILLVKFFEASPK